MLTRIILGSLASTFVGALCASFIMHFVGYSTEIVKGWPQVAIEAGIWAIGATCGVSYARHAYKQHKNRLQ
jgi:uncharacterized membrane protein AbrB (regulator of aidB expression)